MAATDTNMSLKGVLLNKGENPAPKSRQERDETAGRVQPSRRGPNPGPPVGEVTTEPFCQQGFPPESPSTTEPSAQPSYCFRPAARSRPEGTDSPGQAKQLVVFHVRTVVAPLPSSAPSGAPGHEAA